MLHGLNNQKDYMDNTALEMARRGFVVVSADLTGHGSSDGANHENGCGGPDVLTYVRGLRLVDKTRIGLLGMSQGGFCAVTAAALPSLTATTRSSTWNPAQPARSPRCHAVPQAPQHGLQHRHVD